MLKVHTDVTASKILKANCVTTEKKKKYGNT